MEATLVSTPHPHTERKNLLLERPMIRGSDSLPQRRPAHPNFTNSDRTPQEISVIPPVLCPQWFGAVGKYRESRHPTCSAACWGRNGLPTTVCWISNRLFARQNLQTIPRCVMQFLPNWLPTEMKFRCPSDSSVGDCCCLPEAIDVGLQHSFYLDATPRSTEQRGFSG